MRLTVIAFALLATLLGGCSSDQARALLGHDAALAARGHSAIDSGQIVLPSIAARAGQSFAAAPDRGDLVTYPAQATVRRDGAYTWHRTELSETHALRAIDGQLTVTAPSGEVLKYTYQRHVEHPSGDWTWIGRLEGETGEEALITFGAKAAFGSIGQAGKSPLRLTIRDGVSWLVETDDSAVARLDSPATRPRGPDFLLPPDTLREVALAVPRSATGRRARGGRGAGLHDRVRCGTRRRLAGIDPPEQPRRHRQPGLRHQSGQWVCASGPGRVRGLSGRHRQLYRSAGAHRL